MLRYRLVRFTVGTEAGGDALALQVFLGYQFEPAAGYYISDELVQMCDDVIARVESEIGELIGRRVRIELVTDLGTEHDLLRTQLVHDVSASHVLIAEVSERNPNVFFEAGLALGRNIPIIILRHRRAPALPSDLSGTFEVRYEDVGDADQDLGARLRVQLANVAERLIGQEKDRRLRIWWATEKGSSSISLICSVLPEDLRSKFSTPSSDEYIHSDKLGDKDALLEVFEGLHTSHHFERISVIAATDASNEAWSQSTFLIGGPDFNEISARVLKLLRPPFVFGSDDEDEPLITCSITGDSWTIETDETTSIPSTDYAMILVGPNVLEPQTRLFGAFGLGTLGVVGACRLILAVGDENSGMSDDLLKTDPNTYSCVIVKVAVVNMNAVPLEIVARAVGRGSGSSVQWEML